MIKILIEVFYNGGAKETVIQDFNYPSFIRLETIISLENVNKITITKGEIVERR